MKYHSITLWLFNIAMENGPFMNDFPIKTSIHEGFSMAMLNNQMVLYMVQVSQYISNINCNIKPTYPNWLSDWLPMTRENMSSVTGGDLLLYNSH
jgi:hypothetical protein